MVPSRCESTMYLRFIKISSNIHYTMKSYACVLILLSDALVAAKLGASRAVHRRKTQQLGTLREYGSNPQHTLGHCEGDCDNDLDWWVFKAFLLLIGVFFVSIMHLSRPVHRSNDDELTCFQRNAHESVPGCFGGTQDGSLTDYCVRKSDLSSGSTLENIPLTYTAQFPLSRCEGNHILLPSPCSSFLNSFEFWLCYLGDCDSNDDCVGDFICFQRNEHEAVPGCIGGERDGGRTDYCVAPSSVPPPTTEAKVEWSTIFPLAHCQGETQYCHVLQQSLWSFLTNASSFSRWLRFRFWLYVFTMPAYTCPFSLSHFSCNIRLSLIHLYMYINIKGQGDLVCFQRNENEAVPGCDGGSADWSRTDYCVFPTQRQGQISPPSTSTSDTNQISWSTNFPLGKCQGEF